MFSIVTPCVGVWIEISLSRWYIFNFVLSLPAWECGLKSFTSLYKLFLKLSLPAWECGLKYGEKKGTPTKECHSLRGSVD